MLKRVGLLRSTVAPRLAVAPRSSGCFAPTTLVLATVAPCHSTEPNPVDFWTVEVDIVLWGPDEPYRIEVELAALFEVQPCALLRDQLLEQLFRQGSERLHQVARQHVLEATLYGAWGPCDIGPLAPRRAQDKTDRDLEQPARAIGYWVARYCADPYDSVEVNHILEALSLSGDAGRAALELADELGYVTYDEYEEHCCPLWTAA